MLGELTHMDRITQLQEGVEQILTIMASTITYLTSKTAFKQVSVDVPVTRSRPVGKIDPPDVFEANKRELVADLVRKAKQLEFLINSLPEPEPIEVQQQRLQQLEDEMTTANQDYLAAVQRARDLHGRITTVLRTLLQNNDLNQAIDTFRPKAEHASS